MDVRRSRSRALRGPGFEQQRTIVGILDVEQAIGTVAISAEIGERAFAQPQREAGMFDFGAFPARVGEPTQRRVESLMPQSGNL